VRVRTLPAGFIEPCLPTSSKKPPSGDGWLFEIKHDGFRCIARKDGKRVRLYSRPGNDAAGSRAVTAAPQCMQNLSLTEMTNERTYAQLIRCKITQKPAD
jgi:hypothetical protein